MALNPPTPVPYRYISQLPPQAQVEIERNFAHLSSLDPGSTGDTIFIACVDAQADEMLRADFQLDGLTDVAAVEDIINDHPGAHIVFSSGTWVLERTLSWDHACWLQGSGVGVTTIYQSSDPTAFNPGYFSGSSTNPIRFMVNVNAIAWWKFSDFSIVSALPGNGFGVSPRPCVFSVVSIGVHHGTVENLETHLVDCMFGGGTIRHCDYMRISNISKVSGDGVTSHMCAQPAAFGGFQYTIFENINSYLIGGYGAQSIGCLGLECNAWGLDYANSNYAVPGEGVDTYTHNIRGYALPNTGTDPIAGQSPVFTGTAWQWAVPPSVGSALTQHHILVGNASNLAADVAMSGDVAIVSGGATTIQALAVTTGKIDDLAVTSGKLAALAVTTGKIADAAVTHSKYQDIANNTLLGNDTGGATSPRAMSVADIKTMLAYTAAQITADSTTLEGVGVTVQAVLEELDNAIADHLADTSDAHDASAISADSSTLVGTATDVQGVLEELDNGIADHLADTTDAHDASAVSVDASGFSGILDSGDTDVQTALETIDAFTPPAGASLPIGSEIMWPFTTPPSSDWMIEDGSAIDRTTYSDLFDLFDADGLLFGDGDGMTTFNIPDRRGAFVRGADTGVDLGDTGGAETHTHGVGSYAFPNHSHAAGTLAGPSHTHGVGSFAFPNHSHAAGTLAIPDHSHGAGSYVIPTHTHSGANTLATDAHTHNFTGGTGTMVVTVDAHTHNLTGGVADAAIDIGNHTHTLSSHTHTMGNHTHTLSSHTHTSTALVAEHVEAATGSPSAAEARVSASTWTKTHEISAAGAASSGTTTVGANVQGVTGGPSTANTSTPSSNTSDGPSTANTSAPSSNTGTISGKTAVASVATTTITGHTADASVTTISGATGSTISANAITGNSGTTPSATAVTGSTASDAGAAITGTSAAGGTGAVTGSTASDAGATITGTSAAGDSLPPFGVTNFIIKVL